MSYLALLKNVVNTRRKTFLLQRSLSVSLILSTLISLYILPNIDSVKAQEPVPECRFESPNSQKSTKPSPSDPNSQNDIPVRMALAEGIGDATLGYPSAIVSAVDLFFDSIFLTESNCVEIVPLLEDQVYCYQVYDVNGFPVDNQFGAIHIEPEDFYRLIYQSDDLLGDIFRLQEERRTAELIFVHRLGELDSAEEISIVNLDSNSLSNRKAALAVSKNRPLDAAEMDVLPNTSINVSFEVTTTVDTASGPVEVVLTGTDTLEPFEVSQIYSIDLSKPSEISFTEVSCKEFMDARESGTDFGVVDVTGESNFQGIIASRSGDRWIFRGQAGTIVNITMYSDDLDPVLILEDSSRQPIAYNNNARGLGLNARITYQLPADGRYSILARSHENGPEIDVGRYEIRVEQQAMAASNEELDHLSMLTYGDRDSGEVTGSTSNGFVFYGNRRDKVTIAVFDEGGLDPVLKLYSPQGKLISIDQNGRFSDNSRYSSIQVSGLPSAGFYTAVVQGKNGSRGQYSIELDSVGTLDFSEAQNLYNYMTDDDQVIFREADQWTFYANAGQQLKVFMKAKASSFDSALTLLSPANEVLATNDDQRNCNHLHCGRFRTDSYIEYNSLPMDGVYTIIADGWDDGKQGNETGAYGILMQLQ